MERAIIGFHRDAANHWVARLECGHFQHVRHDPPWTVRPWVVTPEGRASRFGVRLGCVKCDRAEPRDDGEGAPPALERAQGPPEPSGSSPDSGRS
ncbi:MAG: DUF3565 domain-containing protein [Acidobacteriota bacterium]